MSKAGTYDGYAKIFSSASDGLSQVQTTLRRWHDRLADAEAGMGPWAGIASDGAKQRYRELRDHCAKIADSLQQAIDQYRDAAAKYRKAAKKARLWSWLGPLLIVVELIVTAVTAIFAPEISAFMGSLMAMTFTGATTIARAVISIVPGLTAESVGGALNVGLTAVRTGVSAVSNSVTEALPNVLANTLRNVAPNSIRNAASSTVVNASSQFVSEVTVQGINHAVTGEPINWRNAGIAAIVPAAGGAAYDLLKTVPRIAGALGSRPALDAGLGGATFAGAAQGVGPATGGQWDWTGLLAFPGAIGSNLGKGWVKARPGNEDFGGNLQRPVGEAAQELGAARTNQAAVHTQTGVPRPDQPTATMRDLDGMPSTRADAAVRTEDARTDDTAAQSALTQADHDLATATTHRDGAAADLTAARSRQADAEVDLAAVRSRDGAQPQDVQAAQDRVTTAQQATAVATAADTRAADDLRTSQTAHVEATTASIAARNELGQARAAEADLAVRAAEARLDQYQHDQASQHLGQGVGFWPSDAALISSIKDAGQWWGSSQAEVAATAHPGTVEPTVLTPAGPAPAAVVAPGGGETSGNGAGSNGAGGNGAGGNGAGGNGAGGNGAGGNGAGSNGGESNGAGNNGAGSNGAGSNGAGTNGGTTATPPDTGTQPASSGSLEALQTTLRTDAIDVNHLQQQVNAAAAAADAVDPSRTGGDQATVAADRVQVQGVQDQVTQLQAQVTTLQTQLAGQPGSVTEGQVQGLYGQEQQIAATVDQLEAALAALPGGGP